MATALLVIILLVQGVSADNIFTAENETNIRDFVNVVMECRKVPGLTLAVVKGNETWTSGFGVADMETGRNVTDRDLFAIGSLGQTFTMALLARELQEKGLKWETKLTDIAGLHLQFINATLTREATLADLLAHRTGLSPIMDYGFVGGYPEEVTRDFIIKRLRYLPEVKPIRSLYLNSNVLYLVLDRVTELLGGKRWEDMMALHLFEPVGMTSSRLLFTSSDVLRSDAAKPYIYRDTDFRPGTQGIYRLDPSETILSNAVDMAKWMRFNLEMGVTETGETILDRDLLSQAFQSHMTLEGVPIGNIRKPEFPIDDVTSGFGYAWFTSAYRDYRRNWKSGEFFSYTSRIWLFPDETLGIFGNVNGPASNQDPGRALQTILSYITDIALGLEPWLTPGTACSFPGPWANVSVPTTADPTPRPVANDYEGSYGSYILPNIAVTMATDNGLGFAWGRLSGKLHPTDVVDQFLLEFVGFWELATEKILGPNYTVRYTAQFYRLEHHDISGFYLTLDSATMKFVKGFDFMKGDTNSCVRTSAQKGTVLLFTLMLIVHYTEEQIRGLF